MGQFQIRFPQLCAWCGMRAPSGTRNVTVHRSQGRRRTRVSFEAPVCEECAVYATTMEKTSKKVGRWVFIGSFVVGLVLTLVVFRGEEIGVGLLMWPFASLMIVGVVALAMSITGLEKRLNRRGAGEPPGGYASESWRPCELTSGRTMRFYSKRYQEQFAALNSGLVKPEE